jgi:hypothetical protein
VPARSPFRYRTTYGRSRVLTVAVSDILDDIARREKDIVALLHEVAQRNPASAT